MALKAKPGPASPGLTQTQSDIVMANLDPEGEIALPKEKDAPEELYRIFEASKIPVSRAVGKMFKAKYDAATVAYDYTYQAWEEAFRYYNHNQIKDSTTPRGRFQRGDNTENIVFANVNTIIPAAYSKNPDIAVNTTDDADADFAKTLQVFLNKIFRGKAAPCVNLKPKAKRAAMLAELTNMGILKLEFTKKSDSRDAALQEMASLTQTLAEAKDQAAVKEVYGQLQALESQVETLEPNGFKLSNVLPHNLLIDPYCEDDGLSDADWVMESTFLPTEYLNARFTKPGKGEREGDKVLIYKPTHKAIMDGKGGERDDDLGLVMSAIDGKQTSLPTSYTDEERLSYLYTYMTEVVFVWDRVTRRLLLFQEKDWSWPIWVWDDPYNLSRFFPYFLTRFTLSTGGVVTPGVTSYYLDQQDTINDINRKVATIRRGIFDNWIYNTNGLKKEEAEKFINALRGKSRGVTHMLGIDMDEGMDASKMFTHVGIPEKEATPYFDKGDSYTAADRISAMSDALRGTQFKTNTTEDAVQAYVDATRIRIGSKTDNIEDTISDLAHAVAEIGVQFFDEVQIEDLIGKTHAQAWKTMTVEQFNSMYSCEIVAGSVEKPTSIFKKKEAIEIVQSIGQFAQSAPSTLLVILRVLENAFTEVDIKPEDWAMMRQEIAMKLQGEAQGGAGNAPPTAEQLNSLPQEVKMKAMQMKQQGASPQEIMQFLTQALQQQGQQGQPQPQPAPEGVPNGPQG